MLKINCISRNFTKSLVSPFQILILDAIAPTYLDPEFEKKEYFELMI
jgi:hypothetical protein